MADGLYALVQAAELLALPTEPRVESKRRLLEEFLLNPFLDDDIQGLALRAGMERTEVEKDIADLCLDGVLKEAGQRGYALDLEGRGAEAVEVEANPDEREEGEGTETEAVAAPEGSPLQTEELREPRPSLGLLLLRADGQP